MDLRGRARAGLLCALATACAGAVAAAAPRSIAADSAWSRAQHARETLEAKPEAGRRGADYTRVIDGFRAVYHEAPRDPHAAEAVNAVAELLAEEGRAERDPKLLKAAIGQYEFLREQYPGSGLRVGALLAEGHIEANDLGDAVGARERYTLLLRSFPRSALAAEARTGLTALERGAGPTPVAPAPSRGDAGGASTIPAMAETADEPRSRRAAANPETLSAAPAPATSSPARRTGAPLAVVSGIRHWSTSSYTRVAIDLGDEVEYQAARVPSPDRIYFDLHGARLAADLVGKSFSVTDDGFLKKIRAAQSSPDTTRVVLDVNDVTEYSAFLLPNPYRLIIDIHGRREAAQPQAMMGAPAVPAKSAPTVPNTTAVKTQNPVEVQRLSEQPGRIEATSVPTTQPIAAVVQPAEVGRNGGAPPLVSVGQNAADSTASSSLTTKRGRKNRLTAADTRVVGDPAQPARAAVRTADGETSLVRALGLKVGRIVIDAGHGGHDSGTLGVDGLEEKDVVLDVALRLGKMLKERMGAEVIYTRSDDTFIPLETRTAIANKAQADLFLSIHANSSSDPSARGVETYYLNFTSQPDALDVAARENAVSGQSIHQLSDLVKKIALKDKIAESREFASDVEAGLYGGLTKGNEGLKNRGVKKAPFVVLIGANMPSVLAEISFVTNPRDAGQLRRPEYRDRVAESLYKGIARYQGGLSAAAGATQRAAAAGAADQCIGAQCSSGAPAPRALASRTRSSE